MDMFLKVVTAKVTPLGLIAGCIAVAWWNDQRNGSLEVSLGVLAVAVLGVVGYYWGRARTSPLPPPKRRIRIAVLPLVPNPASDPVTIMGDGISEQIVRSLAQVADLEVIEERSIARLQKDDVSLAEIARNLNGLDYVVEGTLAREGVNCAVTAQLRRVSDGRTLSAIEKHVPWNSLNHVPASISLGVLDALNIKLLSEGNEGRAQVAVLQAGTGIAEAFEAYSSGKFNLKLYNIHRKQQNFSAADQYYRQAIASDPTFADAYVDLGFLNLIAWETEGSEAFLEESKRYFRDGLNYDAKHPTALAELGYLAFLEGDTVDAIAQVRSAVDERHPRAIPFNVLSLLYLYLGFWEESIRLTEVVNLLDPLYTYPYTNAALSCQLLDLQDDAIRWADRAARKAGGFTGALMKGAAHFRADRHERALESWREGRRQAPDHQKFLFDIALSWVPASHGESGEVNELLQDDAFEIWAHGAYAQFAISLLALAGEHERCLSLLEREKTYTNSYRYLVSDRTLRSLYPLPRFQAYLQERYSEWLQHVHLWGDTLQRPPAAVRTPEDLRKAAAQPA